MLTRISYSIQSSAELLVILVTKSLKESYEILAVNPPKSLIEEIFITEPPLAFFIEESTAFIPKNVPACLTRTNCQLSESIIHKYVNYNFVLIVFMLCNSVKLLAFLP